MTTAETQRAPGTRKMSFFGASRRVFDLSLGEMLWSRRTIFMALVVAAPIMLSLIVRGVEMFGMSALRINGQRVAGFGIFGAMIWGLYLYFIVPVLGVFYGTALMADEVEDKTLTYLFTRPVSRGAVLVGKYLAYLACTILVVLPSVMICFFLLVPLSALPTSFPSLLTDLGLLALGLAVYGSLFSFVGAFFKRPLIIGLVYAFGFQQVALALPGSTKQWTIAYYLNALVPHAMPSDGVASMLQSMFREAPPLAVCLFWLFAYLGLFLWLATRVVERKEYVLEQ